MHIFSLFSWCLNTYVLNQLQFLFVYLEIFGLYLNYKLKSDKTSCPEHENDGLNLTGVSKAKISTMQKFYDIDDINFHSAVFSSEISIDTREKCFIFPTSTYRSSFATY